jgi:hypothetical protein
MLRPTISIAALFALSVGPTPAQAGAVASSFKKETRKGANYWNAQSAIDGKLETCWMVPGESANRGEHIMIDVPKSTVDKIGMVIGWAKSDETFSDYPRVKEIKVQVFNYNDNNDLIPAGSATASFEDKPGMQVVDITDLPVGDELTGGKVKISVVDIYDGVDFPNIGVSEVVVHLSEFDAAAQIQEISSESSGHTRESMVDDNNRSFWAGDVADASITFEAPGFALSRVGITPGPRGYGRVKKVEIMANGRSTTQDVPDGTAVQWVEIPAIVGYTGSAWGSIEMKILEVHEGSTNPTEVAISELDLKATAYEGF